MFLLTIDSGNSNIVFGLYDLSQAKIVKAFRTVTEPTRTADEYIVWLSELMRINGFDYHDIVATIIASVVPESSFNLVSLCKRYFNSNPLIIGDESTKLGIKLAVDHPEQVGADRLVNAISAHNRYGGPLISIDFGTATTFDIVNEAGDYIGGIIAPGIKLSLRALYMAAAKLPLVEIAKPYKIIGKNTEDAMQSGVFWGYVAMIEGLIARIETEYGNKMQVIATGGLSDLFSANIAAIHHTDRNLTLNGLADIYKLNQ